MLKEPNICPVGTAPKAAPAFYVWWRLQGRILQIYLATCLTVETDFVALATQANSQIPFTYTESLLHDCPRFLIPSVVPPCYSCKLTMTRAGSRAFDKIQINSEVRDYLNWTWGGPFLSAAGVVFSYVYKSILLKCQSYRSGGRTKVDLTNREILFMPSQSNSQTPDSCSCPDCWQWQWSMTQRDVYARECCRCNTTPEIPQEKVIWSNECERKILGRFSQTQPCIWV